MPTLLPPSSLADITVPWLNEALAPHLQQSGATVATAVITQLDESSGGTGIYGMVDIEYDRPNVDIPTTLFAKILRHSERVPVPAAQYKTEIGFYQQLGSDCGVRVPLMFYGGFDEESGKAGMLIEDMSAHRPGDTVIGCSFTEARAVVNAIAEFHARWWNDPQIESFGWLLDVKGLMAKVGTKSFAAMHQSPNFASSVAPDSYGAAVGRALDGGKDRINDRVMANPKTLVHTDFRLDNLYFDDSSDPIEPIIFDWGATAHGNPAVDLASFITTGVNELSAEAEIDLLIGYLDRVSPAAPDYGFDQLVEDYRYATLQIYRRRTRSVDMASDLPLGHPLNIMRFKALERSLEALERNNCIELLKQAGWLRG